jgi:hypothetical protein
VIFDLVGAEQALPVDGIMKRPGHGDSVDVRADPAPHQRGKADRSPDHQPRRLERSVLRVNVVEVDFPLVLRGSLRHAALVPVVEIDLDARRRELQRDTRALQSTAKDRDPHQASSLRVPFVAPATGGGPRIPDRASP